MGAQVCAAYGCKSRKGNYSNITNHKNDCMEIFIERSFGLACLKVRAVTYSNYKKHNTVNRNYTNCKHILSIQRIGWSCDSYDHLSREPGFFKKCNLAIWNGESRLSSRWVCTFLHFLDLKTAVCHSHTLCGLVSRSCILIKCANVRVPHKQKHFQ